MGSDQQFVHLRVHTQFSLLEGAIHVDSLIDRVKHLNQPAVAITDTQNMFGTMVFYNEARKAGIKPIIGCELLYSPSGRTLQSAAQVAAQHGGQNRPRFHPLVVLCKDLQGYQNLSQILTRAYVEAPPVQKGQAAGPRALVDRDLLSKWGDGLVVLSGCLRGEIGSQLYFGDDEQALDSIQWFKNRFGKNFYLELTDSRLPEQISLNEQLVGLGKKHDLPIVATSNCHYLLAEDAEAHEILQCIEQGRNLDFDRPKSLVPPEFWVKPAELMRERFEQWPEACDNTLKIADDCNVEFKFKDDKGRQIYHLPNFRPEGVAKEDNFDDLEFFRQESRKGLEIRFAQPGFVLKKELPNWPELEVVYRARLEEELKMIERTGFSAYFLIVADFIQWAKLQGIPVGPGRGSGAGSLVAYSLKITDIDPIEFNLLFERFINPERVSMPDFDVDFCQDRRGEVIDYVTRKYGKDNVSQIITYGKLQTRAVIKDVARVLGLNFAESDVLTKLVPEELGISLMDAIEKEPRLREKMENEPRTAKVMQYALKLEGLYRNAGMHAAGVIITEEPLVTYCPLFVGKDGAVVTQFDKDSAEMIGLVKYDFLGLKTLTVIDHAVKLVREVAEPGTPEADFQLENMNYKDPNVFALISSGDTDGVFQVESSGMKDLCSRIIPNSLEDITAINALYRPGPLGSGMVDDFIDRKHGRKPIVYDVEMLTTILKDTYGVILYQEQVMQIARELAGYSLGQADLLRRAMGKKKPEEMAKHRDLFVKGATERGLDPRKSEGIFDLMAKFAEYGFNKSHSAAYGVLTYQTAYLKTYFPAEFMAALMTTEMDNTDKITKYISDCRAHKLKICSPDVNRSQRRFSVEKLENGDKAVRFGLEAIKGVGGAAVDAILEARLAKKFDNVMDFCRRVPTRKVNKKTLESLTLAGAFDAIAEVNRATLFASLEGLLEMAGDEQEERELGQNSLFDSFVGTEVKLGSLNSNVFKEQEDWPRARKLALEKQTVGFYMSGHPMDAWQTIAEQWLGWSIARIKKIAAEKAAAPKPAATQDEWGGGGYGGGGGRRAPKVEAKVCGLLTSMREVMTKKGSRMAFGEFEDLDNKIEVVFFPEAYSQLAETIKRGLTEAEPLVITADLELSDENPKLLVKAIEWVTEAHKGRVNNVLLKLSPSKVTGDQLRELKKKLLEHRGKCAVRIEFLDPQFKARLDLPKSVSVEATPELVRDVQELFGEGSIFLS